MSSGPDYFSITIFLCVMWLFEHVLRGLETIPTNALLWFAIGAAIVGIAQAAWKHWRKSHA